MNIPVSNPATQTSSKPPRHSAQARAREIEPSLGERAPRSARRPVLLDAFIRTQQEKLLQLRGALLRSINEVARDSRADASGSSALATHQGDAATDACDRDFALRLLSQERNALIEIDDALGRIESGEYGICEMSGRSISARRLKAIPFARFTVECQSEMEKQKKPFPRVRPIPSLFGGETEEESAHAMAQ
jgi:DnaK suppressor protein